MTMTTELSFHLAIFTFDIVQYNDGHAVKSTDTLLICKTRNYTCHCEEATEQFVQWSFSLSSDTVLCQSPKPIITR